MTDTDAPRDLDSNPAPRRRWSRTPLLAAVAGTFGALISGALQELGARLIELFW
ncbi:hypothetical protein ACFWM1_16845 [Nocardia sp. NPDC058379]|uniref:hypothetical protein n=1 Tax=unclassified Nocardia TaxID=2637762 RepID=UPI003650125C